MPQGVQVQLLSDPPFHLTVAQLGERPAWDGEVSSVRARPVRPVIILREHLTLILSLGIIYIDPVGWDGTKLRPETEACEDNTLCPQFHI